MIVSEKRDADEQKKTVEADQEKIGKEAAECNKVAADAKADLDVAMPALEKAMKEVDKLNKGDVAEVKNYKQPPGPVELTLSAVMVLFKKPTDWKTAKGVIGDPSFLHNVKSYDKDNVNDATIKKLGKYIKDPGFTPEAITKVSRAAGALCVWCHAINIYSTVFRDVAPKRERLKKSQNTLMIKQKALKAAEDELAIVIAKLDKLC